MEEQAVAEGPPPGWGREAGRLVRRWVLVVGLLTLVTGLVPFRDEDPMPLADAIGFAIVGVVIVLPFAALGSVLWARRGPIAELFGLLLQIGAGALTFFGCFFLLAARDMEDDA